MPPSPIRSVVPVGSAVILGWPSWRKNTNPLRQGSGPELPSLLTPTDAWGASDSGPLACSAAWSWV